ncbi:MAG: BlaI/MecI/CopY family transcriptional regulator [Candidatus Latescibacteria bacterium]|nr:BlaI/MecI/CopY family transcriptional regulator [Candidatus Latescibacterota bacterium]
MTVAQLGRIQMRIMQILWEKKRATAREISDMLNEAEQIAHNNVQALIRSLEKKGLIEHDVDNRTHIYFPTVKDEKILKNSLHEFINSIFGGSIANLVSSLVKNKCITRNELKDIFEMLDDKEK